ncbi:CU044_2847 family protein [Streptomyces herbicida]|uniref:CU044_2847 family protein n=1 Tax=Streptomyces herbicida TaxID=3065675 RepID=UPI0038CD790E
MTRVARIELPDGTPVWARISGAEELAVPSGELSYTDTGFAERVEASVESLHSLVTGVARSLAGPLRAVRPDEVSVEFGIELTAKAGKVVGLLADGEAKAGITVTLTWNGGGPPDPSSPDPAPDPTPAPGADPTPPGAAPAPASSGPAPAPASGSPSASSGPAPAPASGSPSAPSGPAPAPASGSPSASSGPAPAPASRSASASARPAPPPALNAHPGHPNTPASGSNLPPSPGDSHRAGASTGAPVHGGARVAVGGGGV